MTEQDLRTLLMAWENLDILAQDMITQDNHLQMLFNIALDDRNPENWRAAYIADKVNALCPERIAPYIETMITSLTAGTNSSLKRHFLKLISLHPIPEEHLSFLLNFCLDCFCSSSEPVAVRVHAMQILFNISEYEPDFKPELLEIIEHESELHTSPGILSRGRKLSQQLRKQIKASGTPFV